MGGAVRPRSRRCASDMGRSVIFDAGVFIALEDPARRRVIVALVELMRSEGVAPVTNDAVLAQVWREPARQVPLTRLLKTMTVYPFGDPRAIGVRCARAGTSDVVDASLAVLADQLGMSVLTSDPDDFVRLNAPYQTF